MEKVILILPTTLSKDFGDITLTITFIHNNFLHDSIGVLWSNVSYEEALDNLPKRRKSKGEH